MFNLRTTHKNKAKPEKDISQPSHIGNKSALLCSSYMSRITEFDLPTRNWDTIK